MAEDGDHLPQEEGIPDLVARVLVAVDRQRALELLLGLGTVAAEAPDDPALAEALKTVGVEISDDDLNCPICLEEYDAGAWKETPCGHRFHTRCVEKWLQANGSCPMCRRQVVRMPAAAATGTAASYAYLSIFREYGQDVTDADAMDVDDDAYLLTDADADGGLF